MLGIVAAGVAEDGGAILHALLELDGEADESGWGKIECDESAMGEGDVDGAVGFPLSQMLAGRDLGKEAEDKCDALGRSSKCRKRWRAKGRL